MDIARIGGSVTRVQLPELEAGFPFVGKEQSGGGAEGSGGPATSSRGGVLGRVSSSAPRGRRAGAWLLGL